MIAAAGIKDQELAVIAERSRIDDPAVSGGGDLCAGPGCHCQAFLSAPETVRRAEFLNAYAIDRERQASFSGRKSNCGCQAPRIAQGSQIRTLWLVIVAGRPRALLQLRDQIFEIIGLPGQLGRALMLLLERLLAIRQLLLALLGQEAQALVFLAEQGELARQSVALHGDLGA